MGKYTLLIILMNIILFIFMIFMVHKLCKKKNIKVTLFILISLIMLNLITIFVDVIRVNNFKTPIFAREYKSYSLDNANQKRYNGLWYKVDLNYNNGQLEKIEMKILNRVVAAAIQLHNFKEEFSTTTGKIISINDSNYKNNNYKYNITIEVNKDEIILFYHNLEKEFEINQTVEVFHYDEFDLSYPAQGVAITIEVLY